MKKNKKVIIIIGIVVFILIIIIVSTLLDYKQNNKNDVALNNSSESVDENNIEKDNTEEVSEELNSAPVSITYSIKTEEYNIEGTEHTIKVNQSYANVISSNNNIKQNLQAELDKIADEEFTNYKSKVEETINGEYPIDANFMEQVGDLSLSWSFINSRIDKGVISVKNVSSGSLGGVSWEAKKGYSFNARTGKRLTIDELSKGEKNLKELVNFELRNYIKTNAKRLGLYEDAMVNFEDKVNVDYLTWYLSDDGFTICFEKYKISPDTFEYTIPYEKLTGHMQLSYFK